MHPTIEAIQKGKRKKVPEVKTGYTVEVSQKVTEGAKERVQKFQGLVIKVSHGAGAEKTFTVRKIVEGIGVEKIFPFHSPNITKIHVVKKAKVRRQKLYYMRERFGKSARLSEKHVTDEERAAEEVKMEALYAEAVKAEEKRLKEESAAADEAQETPEPEAPAKEEKPKGKEDEKKEE
jgi:large subunit ribosomal protein L19